MHEAIVVGGGIVGLSAARALAGAGLKVLVVERARVGEEASSAAVGMLAPQAEAESDSPLLDLCLRARDHHLALAPVLLEETGLSVDLSPGGALTVAFDEAEERRLRARLEWQRARGLPVEAMGPTELREAEPNLSPSARFALYLGGDRIVDNVRLTRALAASAVGRGASLLVGRPATRLLVEGDRVTGVQAGNETLHAPVVINAMGAWAAQLPGDPAPVPVEPVRGQIVSFDVSPAPLRHVVHSFRGYVVPRADGRVMAGSTMERAGFDKSVTASGLQTILGVALEIAPLLADLRVAASWAGLRPGTPDGNPIVGAGALRGLVHAAGLFRNGILLGPLVGEAAAAIALGHPPDALLAPFSPARFRSS